MEHERSPLPAWIGYPGLLLFAVFVKASGSPGVSLGRAARAVVLGPLGDSATGGLAMLALGLVIWGLAKPRCLPALLAGFAGLVGWIFLGVLTAGLST